jgi:predicted Zn-ribbon and HTH transcriptional regulator
MPLIYRCVCDNCGYRTAPVVGEYGAVLVDRPVERKQYQVLGAVFDSVGSESLTYESMMPIDDPRFVVLAHPGEASALASTGFSWSGLLWQGRYILTTHSVCRQCGNVFPKRRLAAPGGVGCLPAIVLGAMTGAVSGIVQRSFVLAILAFVFATSLVFLLCEWAATWYVRWRWRSRDALFAAESQCPNCGADDSVTINLAKRLRCPACKEESLSVQDVGIS